MKGGRGRGRETEEARQGVRESETHRENYRERRERVNTGSFLHIDIVPPSMSDSDIVGDDGSPCDEDVVGESMPKAAAGPRRQRPLSQVGPTTIVVVVVACATGALQAGSRLPLPPAPWAEPGHSAVVLGVALTSWHLTTDADQVSEHRSTMRTAAGRSTLAATSFGYLDYPISEVARLADPLDVDLPLDASTILLRMIEEAECMHSDGQSDWRQSTIAEVATAWRAGRRVVPVLTARLLP